jgi:hypothetical protein
MPAQPSGLAFRYGVARQTAEGTPATQPRFQVPAWGGDVAPDQDVNDFETSSTNFMREGQYKSRVGWNTPGLQLGGFVDSAGLLYALLLGAESFSTPTHTLTALSPNPHWASLFKQFPAPTGGAVTNERFEDGRIEAIQLDWAAGQPIKLTVEASGKTSTMDSPVTWTPTTTNAYTTAGPWLGSVGPTLKIDLAATPATTTVTNLVSGSIRIQRPATWDQTTLITPTYVSQSLMDGTFSATAEFDTLTSYRATFFGSTSGTTLSPLLVNGSGDWLFNENPTASANSLQIKWPATQYRISPPVLDPSGGPLHVNLEGRMVLPSSGEPVTVVASTTSAAFLS